MIPPDRAFERLQRANPFAVTEIERPTARQFLAAVDAPAVRPIRSSRRGAVIALGFAVLILSVLLPVMLLSGGDQLQSVGGGPAEFAPDVRPLVEPRTTCTNDGGSCFEEALSGKYRLDQLGTQLTIEIEDSWLFRGANDGFVTIAGPGQRGRLTFMRPTSLSDPGDPFSKITDSSWPVDDLEGWLSRIDERVIVTDVADVFVDGIAAIRFDAAAADDAPCLQETTCAALASNRLINTLSIDPGRFQRIWWFEQDRLEPIVILARAEDPEFLETATDVVNTIQFGPVNPHPVPDGDVWELGFTVEAPPGLIRVPALGGIEFRLEATHLVQQSPDGIDLNTSSFAGVAISYLAAGPDGVPITSVDDAAARMATAGITLTDLGSPDALLERGRVFGVERGSEVSRDLAFMGSGSRTWAVPATARVWLFDTERGVLMVSAGTFEGTFGLDQAIELGESIVSTLTLIDPQTVTG